MELGISPIVTSSMIMQLLTGLKLIVFDQSVKEVVRECPEAVWCDSDDLYSVCVCGVWYVWSSE